MDDLTDELQAEVIEARPTPPKPPYPTLLGLGELILVGIGFIFILGIAAAFVMSVFRPAHFKTSPTLQSLVELLTYILFFGAVTWFAAWKQKHGGVIVSQPFGSKVYSFKNIILIIFATVALNIATEQCSAWIPYSNSFIQMMRDAVTNNFFSFVNVVIAAPVIEEILCRGIILKGLLKNYHPIIAIVISALFFAFIHLNVWQGIHAFVGGLFLGWLYHRFHSVIPCIICHLITNTLAYLFMLFPTGKQSFLDLLGMHAYFIAVIFAAIIFTACCFILNRATKIKVLEV